GGSLQLKTPAEAMDLIELVATNQYMFTSDRSAKRGVMEIDSTNSILARMDAMTQQFNIVNKKLEKIEAAAIKTPTEADFICGICGGPHESNTCSFIREDQP
ncbi:hypothetical protein PIB30_108875, partial [Stylosanthes scabra]|nr:hypothetical protein [Stylosanthes scabra]